MKKFCAKCGGALNKKGECSNCDKSAPSNENKSSKNNYKVFVVCMCAALAVLVIAIIIICLVAFWPKPSSNNSDNKPEEVVSDNVDTSSKDDDLDLSTPYKVPDFDADAYFKNNTELKSSYSLETSQKTLSENKAILAFQERGFSDIDIQYSYDANGKYLDYSETASNYSDDIHPIYQAYFTSSSGKIWTVFIVENCFFAQSISDTYSNVQSVPVILSETSTITSYDGATNKFYINIPNKSETTIKTVTRIDAKTLESLSSGGAN